ICPFPEHDVRALSEPSRRCRVCGQPEPGRVVLCSDGLCTRRSRSRPDGSRVSAGGGLSRGASDRDDPARGSRSRTAGPSSDWYGLPFMPAPTSEPGGIPVHGVRLEIVERGQGRPVLWLHGEEGLDPRAAFLDRLAARARVLAPSHPGFGHSPEADFVDTVDDLAYLYLDLLAERDLREVVVVGASLAGWIAAEMAVKSTSRLAGLVLVGALGIKVGDRETRDIPDIFALPPDEVARLQYRDPARMALDYTKLSDD